MKPIRKLLIANRGEIAIRIIRACQELNIISVAVFSECDRESLHVLMADEAHAIGPSEAATSYLNHDAIITTAKKSGCDAIHPGYGFLSENATFAESVEKAGLIFIGPTARVIAQMGSKTAARTLAQSVNVPIVPGDMKAITTVDDAIAIAAKIGYPVMLKAVSGGGGKGMRRVESENDLASAVERATSEASTAFGDGSVYLEKAIVSPHHVEVQIIGDNHGHIVHVGERECSVQRRHQKIIEESPSPFISSKTRNAMTDAALRLASAVGYTSAGTVEFLVDGAQNFYFLEINSRIQVEHPVTEMVYGLDLVKEQIRIAMGTPLSFSQEDVQPRGHAIECRIYAEDPYHQFSPSPGTIHTLIEPSGPGIRLDSGIYAGWTVPIYYDPILGKLIAWGRNRAEAIQRMKRALSEYWIGGIQTNIPFHLWTLDQAEFASGNYDTHFLSRVMPNFKTDHPQMDELAALAAVHYHSISSGATTTNPTTAWKRDALRRGLR